ncbi:MAG: MgtC/SapB family protein [Rubricoccaceae bacterium]
MPDVLTSDLITLAKGILALALGGAIGWEREVKGKGAGFRTMMLVSFSAFLFVEVSLAAGIGAAGAADGAIRTDPVRAIQSIATGLGFLGAGIVFRDREKHRTRGLTTAASLLVVAPIGIAVALNHIALAVGSTVLLVLVLSVAERIERD